MYEKFVCYNQVMKNLLRIFVILMLFVSPAQAIVTFNVVVLPADLFKVCANYYCFPEMSEIIAQDVIANFNATGRINSPSLYTVRKTLEANPAVKNYTNSVLTRYTNDKSLDFTALKYIAETFKAKSVLIISNDVPIDKAYVRRNVWEMLVLSTDFDISYPYSMETNAVLVDTYNGLVMWNGVYTKKITDNNDNFKAPNSSDAYAKLEYFRLYSRDILAKMISQNIYLRFFPKTIDPQPVVEDQKPEGAYFRFESNSSIPSTRNKLLEEEKSKSREENPVDNSYGELIFGI